MAKLSSAKLKKKEVKTSLIQSIERTLGKLNNDVALGKVKKTIEQAAEKISKKYLKKSKKYKVDPGEKEPVKRPSSSLPLTKANKNYTKKIKRKPSKENIKEAIKL